MQNNFLLCANWKMHKNPAMVKDYVSQIKSLIAKKHQHHFVLLSPALTLTTLKAELKNTGFKWGAQNCHYEDQGAFTGETSPLALKQIGTTHCLIGHSERRRLFFENNTIVQKKLQALLKHHIQPIVCVGETQVQKDQGLSFKVIKEQISVITQNYNNSSLKLCISYEPVWAIGSGQSAEPSYIKEMVSTIRGLCKKLQNQLIVLYGGSVNESNIRTLYTKTGVDGFLVGGASLDPKLFVRLFSLLQ